MTLNELFIYLERNLLPILLFFLALPLVAWGVGVVAEGSRKVEEWSYVYAALVYAACIPGIFALMLNVYLFLFERQSVWSANILIQVVPIVSMVITLQLIRRKIPFEFIPGFGKITGFMTLIAGAMALMWFVDRVRIMAFTYIPFSVLLIGLVLTLVLIRFSWRKLSQG